jgi:hypothetical protein
MPSNFIADLTSFRYPGVAGHSLAGVDQSIIDRYYQSYISRLSANNYTFPPLPRFLEEFGTEIPSSFVILDPNQLVLDPGVGQRWLVFFHVDGSVHTYVAKYIVRVKGFTQMFGNGPNGLEIKLQDAMLLTGVVVPTETIESLRSVEGVVFL